MATLLKETRPKARKDHHCMASELINDGSNLRGYRFTFSEWRAIIKARDNGWKIKKGETYINQKNVEDGYLYSFKAIPAIHDICIKYDYYDY